MGNLLAESAPVRAILMAWPYAESDWLPVLERAEQCYWQMLQSFCAHAEHVQTIVLLHPAVSSPAWLDKAAALGVDKTRFKLINTIAYNDTWIRDYGPLSLNNTYFSYTFNGWGGKYPAEHDNAVAEQLSQTLGFKLIKSSFVAEGGALELNENGMLLANKDCLVDEQRNRGMSAEAVEAQLKVDLGVKAFLWLENIQLSGDDTDGHIDTLARFAEGSSLIACGRNPNHPDALALDALNEQLQGICRRFNWGLHLLPMPQVRSAVDNRLLPATYANFLVVNKVVFLPIYGVKEDEAAERIVKEAFPSYRIIPIRCEALLEQHGSLHCATMQLSVIQE